MIARSNDYYSIENREYLSALSKACDVSDQQLERIEDDYVKASVKLAKAFGLRKEEAIKIIPTLADKGHHLFLKASWCKGGRERTVPIQTDYQRDALNSAKSIAGSGSLIPLHLKYHQQRSRYDAITRVVGLKKLHGLRYQYAQIRYRQLTGWECPHSGGPDRRSLRGEQKAKDIQARLQISEELGHNRIQIVANYIGS